MNEELKALFLAEGIEVSDKFASDLVVIVESGIEKQVSVKSAQLDEDYNTKVTQLDEDYNTKVTQLDEDYNTKVTQLDEDVDAFISSKSKQWLNENKVEIENKAKVELAESLFTGIKTLVESHDMDLDMSKAQLIEDKDVQIDQLTESVNDSLAKEITLTKEIAQLKSDKIITECVKDLADTEIEKVSGLCAKMTYETDDQYRSLVTEAVQSIHRDPINDPINDPKKTLINEAVDPDVLAVLNLLKG